MKKNVITFMVMVLVLGIGGCSEKASFATQEQSRAAVLENIEYNARNYRQNNPGTAEMVLKIRGDSTIGPNCVTGDGWASVDLLNKEGTQVMVSLKCSTVSGTIGCMTVKDFATRYASEEGKCNTGLPFPIPKIVIK